jgi:hypothetical protein
MRTVGEPGTHGAGIVGVHGCGVRTPQAAAVADATAGFAILLHMPNGGILDMGLLSMIVAIGWVVMTFFSGNTINVDGAAPKVHFILAPPQTQIPITKNPPIFYI